MKVPPSPESTLSIGPDPVVLELPRQIMRRALVGVLLGVVLTALLGLYRLQDNVHEELQAARVMALLTERLSALQGMDDTQARLALRQWQAEGPLRHLSLRVLDAQGQAVAWSPDPSQPGQAAGLPGALGLQALQLLQSLLPAAEPFTVAWRLPRPDGGLWTVSLSADADSEQIEALQFVLESVATVAAMSAVLLALMTWNTRRAFRPLAQLLAAIAALRAGRPAALSALPASSVREMQAIAEALRALDQALAQAESERQWLGRKVLTLQEDERQRLARELHDEFGQRLTALRVDAAWLGRQLAGQPALAEVVAGMAQQCEAIQQDIRAVLARLQPLGPPLGDDAQTDGAQRLGARLQALVRSWQRPLAAAAQGEDSRLAVQLVLARRGADGRLHPWPQDGEPAPLPEDLSLALYRISQEALTNAARHAQARELRLALTWVDAPLDQPDAAGQVDWCVEDDGRGIADLAGALHRGNGLAGIKERIWALGADWSVGPKTAAADRPGWRMQASFARPPAKPEETETR